MEFEYDRHIITYLKFGSGTKILIAFHGFGQDASVFYNIEPAIGKKFTIYTINLFHHGGSCFPNDKDPNSPISPEWNLAWFEQFLQKHNIQQFSLMGYSLGGRVALMYMQQMPQRIESMILLAPDGIKKSFWYHYATQNPRGKKLFKRVVERPDLFFNLVKYLRMMGILSKKMEKFTKAQFGDEERRKKVFHVWNAYSHLLPRVSASRKILREYKIPAVIFTGRYDPVLNPQIGSILTHDMDGLIQWHILDSGHDLLKPAYCDSIHSILFDKLYHKLNP